LAWIEQAAGKLKVPFAIRLSRKILEGKLVASTIESRRAENQDSSFPLNDCGDNSDKAVNPVNLREKFIAYYAPLYYK